MGERKEGRIHAGFSAEYEDEIERSRAKLREKHLDWIVVNNPEKTAAAFGGDSNKVTVLGAKGRKPSFPSFQKEKSPKRSCRPFSTRTPEQCRKRSPLLNT
ncbi:MAG: phosphopantothenoylcysteine decarboxylase [Candidatus Marinimicrobia bacterium]|nr:phosphopantothenoylcysteine decarboxylase [Candidatus Neomarinimicrobiota bacterium]